MLTFGALWPLTLLAALPLIWWPGRRSSTSLGRSHLAVATALRALTFVLVMLTLIRQVWEARTRTTCVVYELDS